MIPQEVLFKEAYIIAKAAKTITTELDPIIDLVVESVREGKHIIITGIGKNSDIAKKHAATFSSIGLPSIYLDAYEALHGDLGVIVPGQLMIAFSKSGNTDELNHTFEAASIMHARLVSITCNPTSRLGQIARENEGYDIVIPCEIEADRLNLAPTCSSTLFLAIGDAIGCVASDRIGFTREDFLARHPAGSLGRQLRDQLCK